jgi:hypothetical protein
MMSLSRRLRTVPAAMMLIAAAVFSSSLSPRRAVAQDLPDVIPPVLIPRALPVQAPTTRPIVVEPPVQSLQNLRQWFTELADDDPSVRERARFNLMGIRRSQLTELRQIVADSRPVAPSQLAVLHDIVAHVYLAGEPYASTARTGFLGVMLENVRQGGDFFVEEPPPVQEEVDEDRPPEQAKRDTPPVRGVLIRDTVPGFCAFRYLQPGDLVMGVVRDGELAATTMMQELKSQVASTPPGEPITLELLRQGKQMRVSFLINATPRDVEVPMLTPDQFRNMRSDQAEGYWDQAFAPLVDTMSSAPDTTIPPANPARPPDAGV